MLVIECQRHPVLKFNSSRNPSRVTENQSQSEPKTVHRRSHPSSTPWASKRVEESEKRIRVRKKRERRPNKLGRVSFRQSLVSVTDVPPRPEIILTGPLPPSSTKCELLDRDFHGITVESVMRVRKSLSSPPCLCGEERYPDHSRSETFFSHILPSVTTSTETFMVDDVNTLNLLICVLYGSCYGSVVYIYHRSISVPTKTGIR